MMQKAKILLGALAVACGLSAGAVQALTTTWTSPASVGTSQTVDFACSTATVLNGGVCGTASSTDAVPTGQAVFTLSSVVSNVWNFDLLLSNTALTGTNDGRLVALGFDSNPALTIGIIDQSSTTWHAFNTSGNGDLKTTLCIIDATNNCNGGGNGGLFAGQTAKIGFSVSATSELSSINFNSFAVKFQSVPTLGGQSVSFSGVAAVPVPATLPLLLGGLGILGFAARRKRKAA